MRSSNARDDSTLCKEKSSMQAAFDAPIRTTGSLLDRVLAGGKSAVVSFETPGCGPCQSLRLVLDALAREFCERVLFVRVPDAAEGWLAARWHLEFVPTLVFVAGGHEVARIKGDPGGEAVREHVLYLLAEARRPEPAEGPRHTLRARFGPARPDDVAAIRPTALLFTGR
jgi:thioredoxin-like negative regulator of GroEL